MSYQTISYSKEGPVAVVTLSRPEVLNAQNELLKDELEEAVNAFDADDGVRVALIKGAGRAFSAGHDMKQLPRDPSRFGAANSKKWFEGDQEKFRQFVYKILRQFLHLHYCRKPTIAQVHGHCIGGGWVLASMCDLIIAAEDAQFADPVLRMGSTGVEALVEPWDVGFRKAKEVMWTGEPITGVEAWRLGMVNRAVPLAKLEEEGLRLAHKIALTPPATLQATKRSINRMLDEQGWRRSHEMHTEIWLENHWGDEHRLLHQARENMPLREFLRKRDEAFS